MKQPVGYSSKPVSSDPRTTEAWALGEASRRLIVAAKADDDGASLREALRLNQRLWSIFQAALIEPDCPLPVDVRQNVLSLSIMVDKHIFQRLSDLDGSKIQPILDINRAIAEGLAQRPEMPANAAARVPAQPTTPAYDQKRPIMRVSI
ncbi:MAG TPA: flagellar biosynthesis regulator FlaF [Dongiaceae bacterium]|nr:flagellar biosynthesis regulator FlaF [Dongiaceae bacterium]